jgi:hypothetical protein
MHRTLFIHFDEPLLLRCCEVAPSGVGSGVQEGGEEALVVPDRACVRGVDARMDDLPGCCHQFIGSP